MRSKLPGIVFAWIQVFYLAITSLIFTLHSDAIWIFIGTSGVILCIAPSLRYRSFYADILPWEAILLITIPATVHLLTLLISEPSLLVFIDGLSTFGALSALGFMSIINLQMFTEVRMNVAFASFTVFIFTLSFAGFWAVLEFLTSPFRTLSFSTNDELMHFFISSALAALFMSTIFFLYLRAFSRRVRRRGFEER